MAVARALMKTFARRFLPEPVRFALRRMVGDFTRFSGPYRDWAEASAHASGYDDSAILAKVRDATRRVVAGRAAYEQDSVLFHQPSAPEFLLDGLRSAARTTAAQLTVLDFGGSLGSLYFRVRPHLAGIPIKTWYVCEQPHFAACGRREFEDGTLRFVEDPAETGQVDVLLLSSVLPYLARPMEQLRDLVRLSPRYIVIDRTPLSPDDAWHLLIQHVPRSIYAASYPLWLIPRHAIAECLDGYTLVEEWAAANESVDCGALKAVYRGMIWQMSHPADGRATEHSR